MRPMILDCDKEDQTEFAVDGWKVNVDKMGTLVERIGSDIGASSDSIHDLYFEP